MNASKPAQTKEVREEHGREGTRQEHQKQLCVLMTLALA
jgi:hypothetical protein